MHLKVRDLLGVTPLYLLGVGLIVSCMANREAEVL